MMKNISKLRKKLPNIRQVLSRSDSKTKPSRLSKVEKDPELDELITKRNNMVFEAADIIFILACAMVMGIFDPFILFINTKPKEHGPLIDEQAYIKPHLVIEAGGKDHAYIRRQIQKSFKTQFFRSEKIKRDGLILLFWTPIRRVKKKQNSDDTKMNDVDIEQQDVDVSWSFYDAKGEPRHYNDVMKDIYERIKDDFPKIYIHTNTKGLYTTRRTTGGVRVEKGVLEVNRIIDSVEYKVKREKMRESLVIITWYVNNECSDNCPDTYLTTIIEQWIRSYLPGYNSLDKSSILELITGYYPNHMIPQDVIVSLFGFYYGPLTDNASNRGNVKYDTDSDED